MISIFEKSKLFSLTFTILIVAEIFYFSSQPGGTTTGNSLVAPAYHFIVFFLLNFFIILTIKGEEKIELKHILIAAVFSLVFSFLDEAHQMFVPLRDASITDILTDSAGIFFSTITYLIHDSRK